MLDMNLPAPGPGEASLLDEDILLPTGLCVAISRLRLSHDSVGLVHGEDMVKFHVRLSGQRILGFPGAEAVVLDGAATAVLVHDAGVPKIERVVAGRDELAVTTMVSRANFLQILEEEKIEVPPTLQELMTGKGAAPRMMVAAPTRQELEIADAIINCKRIGPLRRLLLEAKAAELFCSIIDRLQAGTASASRAARISERDGRQLAQVRELLEETYANPPTIHALAHQFGLNRNKLCSGFTRLYGTSIFDFCQELRMQKARQLLLESGLSVLDIAVSSGYTSTSAFSAAFHRRFGHVPSAIRGRTS